MEVASANSNNVKTMFIRTSKFKTIDIDIAFLGEFSRENGDETVTFDPFIDRRHEQLPEQEGLGEQTLQLI